MPEQEIYTSEISEIKKPTSTRIVVMLGARMHKGEKGWVFPLITERDTPKEGQLPVEVSGGAGRMRTLEALYTDFQKEHHDTTGIKFLITGGKEQSGESRAQKAAEVLESKYHIPHDALAVIGAGGNTLGNVTDVLDYISTHKDTLGDVKEIEIVTQDYHCTRAWLMFAVGVYEKSTGKNFSIPESKIQEVKSILDRSLEESNSAAARQEIMNIITPYIAESKYTVKPISVEDTLRESHPSPAAPRYADMIENNRWVGETRKLEAKGVIDFLSGNYGKS